MAEHDIPRSRRQTSATEDPRMDHPLGGGPLSLSCITRVAPHCVNTLMILHVAHTQTHLSQSSVSRLARASTRGSGHATATASMRVDDPDRHSKAVFTLFTFGPVHLSSPRTLYKELLTPYRTSTSPPRLRVEQPLADPSYICAVAGLVGAQRQQAGTACVGPRRKGDVAVGTVALDRS